MIVGIGVFVATITVAIIFADVLLTGTTVWCRWVAAILFAATLAVAVKADIRSGAWENRPTPARPDTASCAVEQHKGKNGTVDQ